MSFSGGEHAAVDRADSERILFYLWLRHKNVSQLLQNKNSPGDEIANVNVYAMRPEATRIRWNNTQNNGHNAVQGHSRSPILVPIESS